MYLGDFDTAQGLFLSSTRPAVALEVIELKYLCPYQFLQLTILPLR